MGVKGLAGRRTGHIAKPTAAHIYPPRRMLRNRGKRAAMSVPADIELAEIFVPSCARAKAVEMIKTPNLSPLLAPSRNLPKSSSGFQTGFS